MKPYIKPGELESLNPEKNIAGIYHNLMRNSYLGNLGIDGKTAASSAVLGIALAALILSAGCSGATPSSQTYGNQPEKMIPVYDFHDDTDQDSGVGIRSFIVKKCDDSIVFYGFKDGSYDTISFVPETRPEIVEKYCGPLNNQTK